MTTKARIIKPTNSLKAKIGSGGIPDERIQRAQDHIESAEIDFTPMAAEFLQELETELKPSNNPPSSAMINAIMQLKGCGGMFRYQLISDVANNALHFVEGLETLNDDAVDVLKGHTQTIRTILTENGGPHGRILLKELHDARERYHLKYNNL